MLLCTLLKYKAWADRRTLDAVAQLNQHKHLTTLAFARQQLNHMVRVEELFRARLLSNSDPHASTNSEDLPQVDELDLRLTASNQWLQDYAQELTSASSCHSIRFSFVDGKSGMLDQEEIIFHLINHGTYHRGAIGHALDLAKVARPPDTYTVFIHTLEPQRRET